MSDYILSCCSTADLSAEHFAVRDIKYVCFHYFLDGKHYYDDLGKSMPFEKFYETVAGGADATTSQVNIDEYAEYFTPFLEAGKDVVHIALSSGLSGAYNSACIAADILKEKFPERNIYIVDSLCASSGYGLFMDTLADLRDEGFSAEKLVSWAEAHRLELHHWFFSTDLSFYVKGGRITKAAGWFGTILKICPVLNMDDTGHLIPRHKSRGKTKAIRAVADMMAEHAQGGLDYSGRCYISNSACIEDAKAVAALVKEKFPKIRGEVEINSVGTTIGSHTGPGTVALFFWGDRREA